MNTGSLFYFRPPSQADVRPKPKFSPATQPSSQDLSLKFCSTFSDYAEATREKTPHLEKADPPEIRWTCTTGDRAWPTEGIPDEGENRGGGRHMGVGVCWVRRAAHPGGSRAALITTGPSSKAIEPR